MNILKAILIIFTFFFLNCTLYPQHLGSLKLNNSGSVQTDTNKIKPYRSGGNAFAAGALSLIVPGLALGQIYNGDWDQFSTHISISILCLGSAFFSLVAFITENGRPAAGYYLLLGTMFIYMGNWVWSIIDAAITADKMDRQKQLKNHSSDLINKLGLGFTFDKKNPKLIFSVRL